MMTRVMKAMLAVVAAGFIGASSNTAEAFWGHHRAVTTGYAPVVVGTPVVAAMPVVAAAPVVTSYAPVYATTSFSLPSVPVTYAPAAPVAVARPVVAAAPIVTAAPMVANYAPATTAYYAPAATVAAPAVTSYYAPAAAYVPTTTYYAPTRSFYRGPYAAPVIVP